MWQVNPYWNLFSTDDAVSGKAKTAEKGSEIVRGHNTAVTVLLMCPVKIFSPAQRSLTLAETTGSPYPACNDFTLHFKSE